MYVCYLFENTVCEFYFVLFCRPLATCSTGEYILNLLDSIFRVNVQTQHSTPSQLQTSMMRRNKGRVFLVRKAAAASTENPMKNMPEELPSVLNDVMKTVNFHLDKYKLHS